MDSKILARIGAVAFVALAITATAIDMSRSDAAPEAALSRSPIIARHDPLDDQLARCSAAGEAGASDPECLKAWSDNRRRFLGKAPAVEDLIPSRPEVR
jgi:conjugative transfer region protein TrbK